MLVSIAKTLKINLQSFCSKTKTSKGLKLASVGFVLGLFVYWSLDEISWILSAIGRLVLIEFLPYWNWSRLYSAKCLIERPHIETIASKSQMKMGSHETLEDNCGLCFNLSMKKMFLL